MTDATGDRDLDHGPERSDAARIVIMGAGGRDFHVFNTRYRHDPAADVRAFTAAQIPHIEGRTYPPELAGPRYPRGIPIRPEAELESLVREEAVGLAVFAYSDVSFDHVTRTEARVRAAGADFSTFDPDATMLASDVPVAAVTAVRTGSGKSQTSRRVAELLGEMGRRVGVVRHPMPCGDLSRQIVQRFASLEDMAEQQCTIEEMEEYEHHVRTGSVVWAGIDYERILREAEREADVILWDGGNNDTPFYRPDLWICVADPLRPGHELSYFPGRWNFERADVVLINKVNEARPEDVEAVRRNVAAHNGDARIVEAESVVTIGDGGAEAIRGRRVLVVEDGPTVTHGEMGYGAGYVAARDAGAAEIVDPRPYLDGEIAEAFERHPHLRRVLPALGYGEGQVAELEETIARAECDAVVVGTPVDLSRILRIEKPTVRVTYALRETSSPGLREILAEWLP